MYGLFWIYREIDGVGVGWQRRCKTCRPLRELDNHGTYPFLPYFFLFLAVAATGGQVISFVLGRESLLRTTRMIGSRRAYGNAPSMQLHCNPIAVPGSGHIGKQIKSFDVVVHMQERSPQKRFSARCRSLFMPLLEATPHILPYSFALGARNVCCLVGENPTFSSCRDARVYYGGTSTAMHDNNEYPPPTPTVA